MIEDSFDTATALSSMYLWLLFGFLSSMVSCDMQTWMQTHPGFRHALGIIAFFFLFTVLDSQNKLGVGYTVLKTLMVYMLFILLTKSKWYFSLPALALMIADQTIKVHINYLQNNGADSAALSGWKDARRYLLYTMTVSIVLGAIHYAWRQRNEFGAEFKWSKLLFSHTCSF